MKLTAVIIIAALVQVCAKGYSQNISLHEQNISIKKVISIIERQTDYHFIYSNKVTILKSIVNININDSPIEKVLDECLKNLPVEYKVFQKTIVIKPKAERPVEKILNAIDVAGVVTDPKGEPLPGVTVKIKGTTTAVSTNISGKYSINLPDDNAILVFSFIGYETQEVAVKGKTVINVTLSDKASALNEVVVIGYGTQQRKNLVSAVSTVKGEDIQNLPTATPQSLIQGRASGIQVVQNSGAPGSAATVRIRGTTSINAGNDPLYIIDGVPAESGTLSGINPTGSQTSALAAIDADDIESMDILKDAGALAIYGSRAANGVVLITTKHGKKGVTSYNFNVYTGWQGDDKSRRIKTLNNQQAIELIQEGRSNALIDGGLTSLYGFLLPAPDGTVSNTDWQSEILRTAPISNIEMSIRGGEEKLKFSISGSYFDQKGIIIQSGFKRGSSRVNLDYDASGKLKLGVNLSFSRYINQRVSTEDGPTSILQVALKKSPSLPIFNTDGTYYQGDVSGFINPVAYANKVQNTNQVSSGIGNIYGEYKIISDLKFRTSLGANYASVLDKFFQPSDAIRNGVASGNNFSSSIDNWVIENTLSYSHDFGRHHVTGLAGYSQQERSSYSINAQGTQYATNNIPTLNAAVMPTTATSNGSAFGLSSAFARLTYAFADRYYFEGSVRRDGSSRFGADRRYAIFPAVSAAWRVSNEPFWNKENVVNDLKIRGSIGKTGNQSIDDYVAQGQYATGASYVGQSGIYLSTLPNPNLTWETTLQYDAGLDISFLNSRISLGVDVYVKNTSNLLLNVPLPHTTGFSSALENVGATQNKGLEFNLNTVNLQRKSLSWNTNFNISFNRNVVTKLYNGATSIIYNNGATVSTGSLLSYSVIQPGSPIGSFYGWKESGVYRYSTDNGAKITNSSVGTNGFIFKGGDMIFQDTNGNGTIDNNDRVIIGNAQPKFTGGMTNTFKYQSFDLSFLMTFCYGNDIANGTRYASESGSGFQGDLALLNRWRNEGDITDVPRQDHIDPAGNRRFSNRWLEDGSYLRCKNLTLGYSLPKVLLQKASIKSFRVYTTAQNLFTITNYKGYDPEASAFNGNVTQVGIDQGTYPQYRALTIGLNVGF